MKNRKRCWIAVLAFGLLVVSLVACGGKGAPPATSPAAKAPPTGPAVEATPVAPQPTPPPSGVSQAPAGKGTYDTVFPLPDDVQNFTGGGGENMVNFQTSLTLNEIMEFYRQALTAKGLTERPILTATTDTTFSMVFDGWPNGKALVIQGVDLGTSRNVNIRFEDI